MSLADFTTMDLSARVVGRGVRKLIL